jgi:TRAP-type C4-dicarboxylate transport system permease small subunit
MPEELYYSWQTNLMSVLFCAPDIGSHHFSEVGEGIMQGLTKLNEFLNNVFALIAGIALVLTMVVAAVNMIMRLLGTPLSAHEVVAFLSALVVALPLGYTQVKKSHIAVDILSSHFSAGTRKVITGISLVLGIFFFFLATWELVSYANTLRLSGEMSETLRIPFFPFTYGVAISCGMMTFCLIVDFLVLMTAPKKVGAQQGSSL